MHQFCGCGQVMSSAQAWILVYFVGVESLGPRFNSHKPLFLEHN